MTPIGPISSDGTFRGEEWCVYAKPKFPRSKQMRSGLSGPERIMWLEGKDILRTARDQISAREGFVFCCVRDFLIWGAFWNEERDFARPFPRKGLV